MFSETRLALLLPGCLLVGNTLASSLEDGVVYSNADTFNNEISVTDDFRIGESGRYEATLKDLENTRPFTQSSLEVSSGSDSLGSRSGPGAFTFAAEPGDFAVSLFASVSVSDEEKEQMREEAQKQRKAGGDVWWHSLSPEQQKARKADVEYLDRRTVAGSTRERRKTRCAPCRGTAGQSEPGVIA